ncbi:glycosyltransferase family 2 protein [Flavobacterium sp. LC2016-01]|uniref:glycosyltransferase family 2 protein n=1 Tax=Flavobacterium sp. LC2016-01 TaxID=2675876 RepID=UPI0012BAA371|nr:glycosyltransferase family 2 protein [Flavobacterium sp. LC2016-01]MTH17538.1 glycosyltransferase [Flavobacterium sp. LC2016-01]
MNEILISIIIPTYNRANLLGQTLDSVLEQTYTNWECIVVDDGSTDETEQILLRYCKQDSRFQYHKRPKERPKGGNVCRNFGFELSNGAFIKWLDSDDLLSNDLLLSQVNVVRTSLENNYILATSKWNYFSETIENVGPKIKEINKNYNNGFDLIYDFGTYNTFLPPHTYLVKRELVIKSGLWNESLTINQDGEFFTRVLLNTSKVLHAESGIAFYRYGFLNDNVSSFSNTEKCRDAILSWILIDSYIKLKTKKTHTIKYVENGKQYLIRSISDKDLLNQYLFFFGETLSKKGFYEKTKSFFYYVKVMVANKIRKFK